MNDQDDNLQKLLKKIKDLEVSNHKENEIFISKFELFNFIINEYGLPKDGVSNAYVKTAIEVIGSASKFIIGLRELQVCKDNLINGGTKLLEVSSEKITKQDESNDFLANQIDMLNKKVEKDKVRLENAGNKQIIKYIHTFNVSLKITEEYAAKYPNKLNKANIVRGVKAEIDKQITAVMSQESEYKKANLIGPPTQKTVEKHRKSAFKSLGYSK